MGTRYNWQVGELYEPYVGRWSVLVAREFIEWLAVPPGARWLDVGCGTGALSETILRQAQPSTLTGIDASEGFVEYARRRVQDGRASIHVGNAMSLPFDDGAFDAIVSGLVLNFIPDYRVALGEMARVAAPGATVAAYVWDYAGEMQMLRYFFDAAVELDPSLAEHDEGKRFPICKPGPLARLFEGAGLTGVEVRAIDAPTHFRDFDDYWSPFLGGQGPAPSYVVSLDEEKRTALRDLIKSRLPVESDGTIRLTARAWAVRGTR